MVHLRSIAVTVEEPSPGAFHWLLLEAGEGGRGWALLESSDKPFKKYRKAMAAGLAALEAMIEDLDLGPREDRGPSRVTPPAGPFGFGAVLP